MIRGTDHGIWRRIKLIPFTQTFEVGKERDLDETLEGEKAGILNWLLEGLADWRENGLIEPAIVQAVTTEYREESDPLADWLYERTENVEGHWESSSRLFKDYERWLTETGNPKYILHSRTFGIMLMEKGYESHRKSQARGYVGLAIRPVEVSDKGA